VTASFLLEAILSALYAPILMVVQCVMYSKCSWEGIPDGCRSAGIPAARPGSTPGAFIGGTCCWLCHRGDRLLHLAAVACLGYRPHPRLFLAVPLSRLSGSEALGKFLSRLGLLRTPEEVENTALVARREDLVRTARDCR